MAIKRGPVPADNFTIINNDWLRDSRLTWKAKGLLAYIASHAPGHVLTTEQIVAQGKESRDAVRAGLLELERAGYLTRRQNRGPDGRVSSTDYELTEPGAGKPVSGSDQEKEPVSAGQDQCGKSGAGDADDKKTISKKTKNTPSASPRGTRIPPDWMPSEQMKSWCAETLPPALYAQVGMHLLKFRNYWESKAGKDATKINWNKTFQNWMISEASRFPTSGAPSGAARPQPKLFEEMREDRVKAQRARDEMIDVAIERIQADWPGLPLADVVKEAKTFVDDFLAQQTEIDRLNTSRPTGYIDADVVDIAPKEVAGS